MSISFNGTSGLTFPDASTQATGGYTGFRNRIINGGMTIDQRNAGASVTAATTQPYTLDRWQAVSTQNSKFTIQQNAGSVTPPTGFTNYLGVTSSSAYTVASGDVFLIRQNIEGLNISGLGWGTANAASITLSFWVRSSLTGTFGGRVSNSTPNRSYPFSYTINAANTWEQKSITIVGDTTGTWLTTNGVGMQVCFSLGAGSTFTGAANTWAAADYTQPTGATSVVGTSGATFYITGVQLEKGSVATPFEFRPYGTELALCQRYFISYGGQNNYEQFFMGQVGSATTAFFVWSFPVEMRIAPSGVGYSAVGDFLVNDSVVQNSVTSFTIFQSGTKTAGLTAGSTSLTTGRAARLLANNTSATRLTFSAEL